eukprot:13551396-Ditylum_brightwellii.AAC.1
MAQELYYVSDGGADDGIGYFGWLIATDTKILIEGNVQALGKESLMESLQAETYGGISLFLFLQHVCVFKNTTTPPNHQLYYCDNSTLIKYLQQDQSNNPFPNQYSLADYTTHMTLQSIIKLTPGNLSIWHVRGHQDWKQSMNKTKLTWVARRNIRADHLATNTKLRLLCHCCCSFLPLTPAIAYLLINNEPITRTPSKKMNTALTS